MQIEFEEKDLDRIVERVVESLKPLLMPNNKDKEGDCNLFSVKTLGKYLAVSDQWIYERTKLKEIPYLKVGKFPRFRKNAIDKWLDSLNTPVMGLMAGKIKR